MLLASEGEGEGKGEGKGEGEGKAFFEMCSSTPPCRLQRFMFDRQQLDRRRKRRRQRRRKRHDGCPREKGAGLEVRTRTQSFR